MITIRADARAKNRELHKRIKDKLNVAKDKAYRQKVFYLFRELLDVSYQFSGEFTSNWHIITDQGGLPQYKTWPAKAEMRGDIAGGRRLSHEDLGSMVHPHQSGDLEAINFAFTRSKFVKFGAGDKLYFANTSPLHFTGTTVTDSQGDTKPLRPENVIAGGETMQSYIKSFAERKL